MVSEELLNNNDFDKDRLFKYVMIFSFPRLAGTEGEKEAVNLTIKTFKEIGFNNKQIEREPFEFSDFYSTTLIKFIMIINLTFNIILLYFYTMSFFFTFPLIGFMTLIIFFIIKGLKHPEKKVKLLINFGSHPIKDGIH